MIEYQRATEAHDVQAVIALLAPDIVVRSPITNRIRFEGIEQVSDLFVRIFDVISDIRFYETIGEGEASQVIFWRARVGRHYLEESNLLRLDDQGRIREMTVFMRPVSGLMVLATELVSSFARSQRARPRACRADDARAAERGLPFGRAARPPSHGRGISLATGRARLRPPSSSSRTPAISARAAGWSSARAT